MWVCIFQESWLNRTSRGFDFFSLGYWYWTTRQMKWVWPLSHLISLEVIRWQNVSFLTKESHRETLIWCRKLFFFWPSKRWDVWGLIHFFLRYCYVGYSEISNEKKTLRFVKEERIRNILYKKCSQKLIRIFLFSSSFIVYFMFIFLPLDKISIWFISSKHFVSDLFSPMITRYLFLSCVCEFMYIYT